MQWWSGSSRNRESFDPSNSSPNLVENDGHRSGYPKLLWNIWAVLGSFEKLYNDILNIPKTCWIVFWEMRCLYFYVGEDISLQLPRDKPSKQTSNKQRTVHKHTESSEPVLGAFKTEKMTTWCDLCIQWHWIAMSRVSRFRKCGRISSQCGHVQYQRVMRIHKDPAIRGEQLMATSEKGEDQNNRSGPQHSWYLKCQHGAQTAWFYPLWQPTNLSVVVGMPAAHVGVRLQSLNHPWRGPFIYGQACYSKRHSSKSCLPC